MEEAENMPSGYALPIILLIVGISLFFIEAVVPSMGIITVAGVVSVVVGIVTAFGISTAFGFAAIVCVMIAAPLAVMFFFYVARRTSLVLSKVQESTYASSASREHLMGKTGVAASLLRPVGVATIDGKRIDVTAEADFISEGTRVEVVRVDGIKVVVREVKK